MTRAESFAMQYGFYDKEKKRACCVGYNAGYKQAEKDLALTWRDIMVICEHYVDVNYEYDYHSIQEKYEEILRRFKEANK